MVETKKGGGGWLMETMCEGAENNASGASLPFGGGPAEYNHKQEPSFLWSGMVGFGCHSVMRQAVIFCFPSMC